MDFSNLVKDTQKALDDTKSSGGTGDRSTTYPVIYPGEVGSLKLRLFYSEKFGALQSRQIARHDGAKGKVVCLNTYGEDCPVCAAISEVESVKGEKCGVRAKYKAKNRWLCYAQLVDFTGKYCTREHDPKKGDTIIFMYPIQVFKAISNLVIEYADNLDKIIGSNEAKPFIFNMAKTGSFIDYKVQLDAFGTIKSFSSEDEFKDKMGELPNINGELCDANSTEEVRVAAKALAETIRQEYMNNNIVNPGENVQVPENNNGDVGNAGDVERMVSNMVNTGSVNNGGNDSGIPDGAPDCFGHRENNSEKCSKCLHEPECYLSSL